MSQFVPLLWESTDDVSSWGSLVSGRSRFNTFPGRNSQVNCLALGIVQQVVVLRIPPVEVSHTADQKLATSTHPLFLEEIADRDNYRTAPPLYKIAGVLPFRAMMALESHRVEKDAYYRLPRHKGAYCVLLVADLC